MVLEKLSESLQNALKKLITIHRIDENILNELIKDIQKSLITADVDVKLVLKFSTNVKNRALNEKIKSGLNLKDHVLKIVYDELINIIGIGSNIELKKQNIIIVGLQGSGKTTTISKLAYYYQKKGLKVGVIGADTFRAGAYQQLYTLCKENNIFFYGEIDEMDPINIIKNGLKICSTCDIILVDTAGRHSLEHKLIDEMKEITDLLKPENKFLILDAGIGQLAKVQAKTFHESIGITGIIVTKLDGTANGGGALSAISEINVPIVFIGTGETIIDFEKFNPDGFISRLLGMGDIKLLINKIKDSVTEKDINIDNLIKGKFTLNDMYKQLETMNKLGPLKQIFQLLPLRNFGNFKFSDSDLESTGFKIKQYKFIMDSMTNKERETPSIISNSHIIRIASGSGVSVSEIKELLKHYKLMKNTLKDITTKFGSRNFQKLMKKNK